MPDGLALEDLLTLNVHNPKIAPGLGGVDVYFEYEMAPRFRKGYYGILVDGKPYGSELVEITSPGVFSDVLDLPVGSHTVEIRGWYNTDVGTVWKTYLSSTVEVLEADTEWGIADGERTADAREITISPLEGGFEIDFNYYLQDGFPEGALRLYVDGRLVSPDPIPVTKNGSFRQVNKLDPGTYRVRIDALHRDGDAEAWGTIFMTDYRLRGQEVAVAPTAITKPARSNTVTIPSSGEGYFSTTQAGDAVKAGTITLKPGEELCVLATPAPGYTFAPGTTSNWCFTGVKLGTGADGGKGDGKGDGSGGVTDGGSGGGTIGAGGGSGNAGNANTGTSSVTQQQGLAATGSSTGLVAGGAVLLLVGGAALLLVRRLRTA